MKPTDVFKRFVNWMENGDLIPVVIGISVPHYAVVLAKYDFWAVAAVLGFLVDVGHYRTIKTYLRGNGPAWMIVLTVFSTGFHIAFYALGGAGLWAAVIGCAVPAVIFALAFISRKEKLDSKVARSASVPMARQESAASTPIAKRGTYSEFVGAQLARNGNGPMSVNEVMAQFAVPKRTAYNWLAKYREQHPEPTKPVSEN